MAESAELVSSPALSVSQAARLLGVSVSSLRAWAAVGDVPHVRTAGGHRRFRREDLEQFVSANGGTLPDGATPRRLMGTRVPTHSLAADRIAALRDQVVDRAEEIDPAAARRSARARAIRRGRLEHLVDALAEGLASGDMGEGIRLVDWWSYRAGAGGDALSGPVGDVMAVARALERELVADGAPDLAIRATRRACDRLVTAATVGYASGAEARWEVADAA